MGTTPTYSWPYPESTDPVANGAQDIEDLALAVETTVSGLPQKIVQVVNSVYTTPTTISTATLTDTGLSASITPTDSANDVLVIVTQSFQTQRASDRQRFRFQIERDATAIVTDSGQWVNLTAGGASSVNQGGTVSAAVLDSPATTSSVTYSVQVNCELPTLSGAVLAQYNDAPSTITLMEVSP